MKALDEHVLSSSGEGYPNILAEAIVLRYAMCDGRHRRCGIDRRRYRLGIPPGDPAALACALKYWTYGGQPVNWPVHQRIVNHG